MTPIPMREDASTTVAGLMCRNVDLIRADPGGDGIAVLHRIDAAFAEGAVHVISGPTGAGKTTLLQVLGGLLRPTRGEVVADGRPVSRWISRHRDRWRRQVGFVFQQPRLMDGLTVLENVMLPLVPRGYRISELRDRGRAALEALDAGRLAGRRVATLSGGERQLATISRAIVGSPRFLMADEPTAHQDDRNLERIVRVLERLVRQPATVVVATHDPRLVDAMPSGAIATMAGGRLTVPT